MPTCPTCHGEYSEHTWLRPEKDATDRRLCPRCQSDVLGWERIRAQGNPVMRSPLPYVPALVAVIGTVLQWPPHLLGSVLAIALSLVAFFVLSNKAPDFWLSAWANEFKAKPSVSLVMIELGAFLAGLAMALLTIVLIKYWIQPPATPAFPEKLTVSLTYSLSFVLFTVAFVALLLNRQVARLNRHVPQPIFVDSQRLLNLVLDEAQKELGTNRKLKMTRFERSGDVGIHLFASQGDGARWEIAADRWGRIRSLKPVVEEW